MTRVLVAKEKHGTRYFDVSSDVRLAQACCKLLRERLAEGYYQPGQPPTGEPVSDETLAALPDDVRAAAADHNRQLRWLQRQHTDATAVLSLIQEVLASPQVLYSGRQVRAWTLLRAATDPDDVDLFDTEMGSETIRPDYISEELHFRMEQEGWSVFDHDGRPQVMKLDELGKLTDDVQAWELARVSGLTVDAAGYVDTTQPSTGWPLPPLSLYAHGLAKLLLQAVDRPVFITDVATVKLKSPRLLDIRHGTPPDVAEPAWLLVPQCDTLLGGLAGTSASEQSEE